MNTLEIAAIIVIVCCIFYGKMRGLVGMLLPLVANLITLIILGTTKRMWKDVFFTWVLEDINLIGIRILVIVILYVILMLAIKFVIAALKILAKLPLIKEGNKILGVVAGMVQGLLLIWAFLAIVQVFQGTGLGVQMLPMIKESRVISFLYDNNLITYVISDLI